MPADQVNPAAVAAMAEVGIDIAGEQPKLLTDEAVQAADVVVTMGCGDACPYFPGKRYEDWVLDDPAGQGIEAVRPIRDEIRSRVLGLLDELGVRPARPTRRTRPDVAVASGRHALVMHQEERFDAPGLRRARWRRACRRRPRG